jgi:hypothetical protein
VSSLTPRAVWFVGLCHICRRCSSSDRDTGKTPVQRHTGSRGPGTSQSIRRSTSTFPDSSLGVHRSPLRRHNHHCVVTRLGRRPDFGSGLPRPDRVPLLPFLPASAVSYAASRSEDPLVRRSAGLLHPAADHGVRQVSDPLARPRSRAADPKIGGPEGPWRVVPCGEDPSKRSPPRQPSTMPSPRPVLSDAAAFTGWRSLSPFELRSLACRHAALCRSRPQGFLPPRSPLRSCDVAVARPLDAPLGFGSTRFRRCRAHRAAQLSLDVSPGGPNRFGVPRPERGGKAGCFGPVWLHATDGATPPKGDRDRSRWLRYHPKEAPRPHSTTGLEVECQWIRPERRFHRAGPTPEGVRLPTSSRRISEETRARPSARSEERRPVVRAPSLRPSAVARVHEERPLAADLHTRRCARLRATRAHPRLREGSVLRRTRHQGPEGLERRASRRRHPEVGPWRLVAPASPASWSAGSGPDSRRVHRDGRDSIRRRSLSSDPKIGGPAPKRRGCGRSAHPTRGGDPPRAPKCPRRDGP